MSFWHPREGLHFQFPLIKQVIDTPADAYSGVRKLVQAVNWETTSLPMLTYTSLGYKANKEKQLFRNYWNDAEFERVQAVLNKRAKKEATSVAMSMRGAQKDSRSQGWCMLSVVFTQLEDRRVIEVQYRSNELILKLGADLVFLQALAERMDFQPNLWRFRFANAYLSGVFMPTLCSFCDPVRFLDYLWEHDKKLFAGGTRFFLRSSYKKDQSFPYSPENQQHKFAWERLNMKRIRDYLHEKHKMIGKPLPRTHHPLEP